MTQTIKVGTSTRLLTALSDRPNRANTAAMLALAQATTDYLDDGSLTSRAAQDVIVDLASPDFPQRLAVTLGVRPGTIRDRCSELERRYETRGQSHSRGCALVLLAAETSMGELFAGFLESLEVASTTLANDLHATGYLIGRWAREHTLLLQATTAAISSDAGSDPRPVNAITRLFELVLNEHGVDAVEALPLSTRASRAILELTERRSVGQSITRAIVDEAKLRGLIAAGSPGFVAELAAAGATSAESTLVNELLLTEVGYREPDDWEAALVRDLSSLLADNREAA